MSGAQVFIFREKTAYIWTKIAVFCLSWWFGGDFKFLLLHAKSGRETISRPLFAGKRPARAQAEILFCAVDGLFAEFLEEFGQFQRSLGGAGAGGFVGFFYLCFSIFYKCVQFLLDLFEQIFHVF